MYGIPFHYWTFRTMVVTTILLILASAIMPVSKVVVQRQREVELRR